MPICPNIPVRIEMVKFRLKQMDLRRSMAPRMSTRPQPHQMFCTGSLTKSRRSLRIRDCKDEKTELGLMLENWKNSGKHQYD